MRIGFPIIQNKDRKNRNKSISESIDFNELSNRSYCETPRKPEDYFEKELIRLESELDDYEIKALNSKNLEFKSYKIFLEGIACLVKQKIPVLGLKIIRGIHG